jgi:hypothetical protein
MAHHQYVQVISGRYLFQLSLTKITVLTEFKCNEMVQFVYSISADVSGFQNFSNFITYKILFCVGYVERSYVKMKFHVK